MAPVPAHGSADDSLLVISIFSAVIVEALIELSAVFFPLELSREPTLESLTEASLELLESTLFVNPTPTLLFSAPA